MRVLVVGGIFDKPDAYRASHRLTPETILAEGLAARGIDVTCAGHAAPFFDVTSADLVHVHHLGTGALRAAVASGAAALVYTHHRPFVGVPSVRTRLVGVDSAQPSLSDLRPGAATRLVMRCSDAVVALSNKEAEMHHRLYRVPPDRQAVIPNGIPPEPFAFIARSVASPPELLYVGQLVPFKRVDLLLEAVALLPDIVRLRLVHQVDDLRADLEDRAERLGIGARVTFEGPKPPEEIARLLGRAVALVLPSAMEALPSVVTEAMLAGVPVVATDVGGVRDQVDASGVVVEPGNAGALAAALQDVVRTSAGWLARADDIRRSALERFGVDRMVDDHVALYERTVARPGRRREDLAVRPWRQLARYTRLRGEGSVA